MRPAPIPADEVWEGATRVVIGPPGGDLDSEVASVEVLRDTSSIGPRLSARCILEDGDIEKLSAGGTVWVSFYGGALLPFSVDVQAPRVASSTIRITADTSGGAPSFLASMTGVPEGMDPATFAEGCAEALLEMANEWRASASVEDSGRC